MISRRASAWLIVASLFILIGVTLAEAPLVEARLKWLYFGSRGVLTLAMFALLFLTRFNDRIWYGLVWAVIFYIYTVVGEVCRPLYIMSLFQIQVLHAAYFKHSRLSYLVTHVAGTLAFIVAMALSWPDNVVRLREAALADQLSIAFIALNSAMFIFFYLEKVRSQSVSAMRKLALAGSYATSLIHDMKNMSAGPLLYSDILATRKLTEAETRDVIVTLNDELKKMKQVVRQLYDTSKIGEPVYTECSLREMCELASSLVADRLHGISIKISGDSLVKTDRTILQMILLNLFYNATAAVSEADTKEIDISIVNDGLQISNATTRASSSGGLGLNLMRELGQQSNVDLEARHHGGVWTTSLRVRPAWTQRTPVLDSI